MERLIILGPGRVGLSLGRALQSVGALSSLTYWGRHPSPPEDPLFEPGGGADYRYGVELPPEGTTAVLLTVPDRHLREVAELLAARGIPPEGLAVLHCSGALGAEPLAPLHARGYQVGTLHPLQAIAHPAAGAERLLGASFAISGEPGALNVARRLVRALEGHAITIPTQKRPLYHAAAVVASNYLVVLLNMAARLLEGAGASRDEAAQAIVGLARGSLENAAALGLERSLTGPVSRGDLEVVNLHLRTLDPHDAALYAALAQRALEMAEPNLPEETVAAFLDLLKPHLP
jgi:predicted short-subunit dehydrogenase-like oxidoreductase (DUF2520 family)